MLTQSSSGGVASATITLGAELDSAFFRVIAEVLTAIIVLVWVICFARTVRGAFSGELFPKPGVCELRPESGAKVWLPIRPMMQYNEDEYLCLERDRLHETCQTKTERKQQHHELRGDSGTRVDPKILSHIYATTNRQLRLGQMAYLRCGVIPQ
jgi:hypothetical protein